MSRLADLDPEFVAAYEEAMFDDEHRAVIEQALRDIDAARRRLIDAQNELSAVLAGTSQYARHVFSDFYGSGLVTAADWRAYSRKRNRNEATTTPPRQRGQLRVVRKRNSANETRPLDGPNGLRPLGP